jgi:hypothetical protein
MGRFLFKEWSFKGAVRTNPKFLSASIHDLYFLVAAGFLALIASKDAFDRAHNSIVFMEGFNVCVWAEYLPLRWLSSCSITFQSWMQALTKKAVFLIGNRCIHKNTLYW